MEHFEIRNYVAYVAHAAPALHLLDTFENSYVITRGRQWACHSDYRVTKITWELLRKSQLHLSSRLARSERHKMSPKSAVLRQSDIKCLP